MSTERDAFFLMVDSVPVHPLVAWARGEIQRLEQLVGGNPAVPSPEPAEQIGGSIAEQPGGKTALPDG